MIQINTSRYISLKAASPETAELKSASLVIELGSGTGGTTQAILQAMPTHARLLCIEINPLFYQLISSIKDARLIAHLGNAADLKEILSMYGLGAPDVIISGIPFSTMSPNAGSEVLAMISAALPNNGRFVAYQVSNRVMSLCKPFLGAGRMELELFNIPPMRVFRWEKQNA